MHEHTGCEAAQSACLQVEGALVVPQGLELLPRTSAQDKHRVRIVVSEGRKHEVSVCGWHCCGCQASARAGRLNR